MDPQDPNAAMEPVASQYQRRVSDPRYQSHGHEFRSGNIPEEISDAELEELQKTATHVENLPLDREDLLRDAERTKHIVKKQIRVPIVKDVQVPVVKRKVENLMGDHVVRGIEMHPVVRYRDVQETVMEPREEVVQRMQERWVTENVGNVVEEVKRAVPVRRTEQVQYTDFIENPVQKVVEVPNHTMKRKHGYRVDKFAASRLIEVEEDVHYEMVPVYVGKGEVRVRQIGYEHHGAIERGKTIWHTGYNDNPTRSKSTPPLTTRPCKQYGLSRTKRQVERNEYEQSDRVYQHVSSLKQDGFNRTNRQVERNDYEQSDGAYQKPDGLNRTQRHVMSEGCVPFTFMFRSSSHLLLPTPHPYLANPTRKYDLLCGRNECSPYDAWWDRFSKL